MNDEKSFSVDRFVNLLFILVALCTLVTSTEAQQGEPARRNITGYVFDRESGEALPGANVLLKGTTIGASTNVDGYFVILNVPTVLCSLQVSFIGYEPENIKFDNRTPLPDALEILLNPSVFLSDEVIVTGEISMIEISKEPSRMNLSPLQLAVLPNMGEVDIFRSLQLLPGISGANEGSSGLYIRGGTPDQNLILYDGMKIYHVDHFFGFFSAFNSEAIKDVKLYKGGFPAEYGGRISSVVDLTGKTGNSKRPTFSVGANLLSANGLFEMQPFKNAALLISARRSYTDYLKSGLYKNIFGFLTGEENTGNTAGGVSFNRRGGMRTDQAETTPDFYFYDLNGKFTWSPTYKDKLSLSVYNGKDFLDQSTDFSGTQFRFSQSSEDASMNIGDITDWGNTGISGKWSHQWNDHLYSHFLLSTSTYFSTYERRRNISGGDQDVLRFSAFGSYEDNNVTDITFKTDNEFKLTNSHMIKFGAEISDFNTSYDIIRNDTTIVLSRDTKAAMNSLYLQDTWTMFSPLDITVGIRGTDYSLDDDLFLEPRTSFVFRLTDKFSLKGAWGQYNQYVRRIANENILEGSRDFWILSDNELKPSYSEHSILGLSFENTDYLFDFEGYYKDLDNLLEYTRRVTSNIGFRNMNVINNSAVPRFVTGYGNAKGIDVLAQKKRGLATGWISYTYSKTENIFADLNNGSPFPSDHDRTHEIKFVGMLKRGLWSASATWVYASGKAYTSPESQYYLTLLDGSQYSYIHVSDKNSQRLPDYHRLDISVTRRFESDRFDIDVGGSVFNAYNNRNVYFREYTLDTTPILITDKLLLGFTPTLYVKMSLR